ncbi:MAG TPA: hypothetical protein VN176_19640 [Verrucomicrobiae bacterium]|jgi:hypothetical protein|nr:hypothetical protein [Verrucomicrobiae bacterium]
MGRAFGFFGLVIVVAICLYLYMRQSQSVTPEGAGSPQAAIDVTGVKADLLSIAQAERTHHELQGSYVSIGDLRSAGDFSTIRDGRGPYTYSAEISGSGFRIVATYTGPPGAKMPPTISIDETMHFAP